MRFFEFLYAKIFRTTKPRRTAKTIYDLTVKDINGNDVDFNSYRGKNLLIVNTASKCGFTPQYQDLEKLHRAYSDHVTILGFPANNFLWQEPGSDKDIASFCQENYDVTFKMFTKINVIGKHQHPLYQWLHYQTGNIPMWNFCKYLVLKNGKVVRFFPSKVNPLDPVIVNEIIQ
jgi:glutathione peroxidase